MGITFVHANSNNDLEYFINIFLSELFEKKGYGVDVFVLFSLFLFNQVGVERLFVEASSYNKHSLSCIKNIGMTKVNGNTKIFIAGAEYDLIRFEVDEQLIPKLKRIKEHLSIPNYQQV